LEKGSKATGGSERKEHAREEKKLTKKLEEAVKDLAKADKMNNELRFQSMLIGGLAFFCPSQPTIQPNSTATFLPAI
jgi:hypothetical protein